MKLFLSGDEALAEGVRLAHPQVISAYPITPQTVVVERLSDMVVQGDLDAEFIHVESEHSALACAIGASATGARTFTATSSQGLLYMAECLTYASGGRFPIVMMNATRATALPWNILFKYSKRFATFQHTRQLLGRERTHIANTYKSRFEAFSTACIHDQLHQSGNRTQRHDNEISIIGHVRFQHA